MRYETKDRILPRLNLGRECDIAVEVTDRDVRLYIGPRDWQWDRETGDFIGCGTCWAADISEDSPSVRQEPVDVPTVSG